MTSGHKLFHCSLRCGLIATPFVRSNTVFLSYSHPLYPPTLRRLSAFISVRPADRCAIDPISTRRHSAQAVYLATPVSFSLIHSSVLPVDWFDMAVRLSDRGFIPKRSLYFWIRIGFLRKPNHTYNVSNHLTRLRL